MCRTHLVPVLPTGKKFRFVYTSGGLVPYLDSNFLFFLGNARKLRGIQDQDVLKVGEEDPEHWESFVARPWHVVNEPPMMSNFVNNSYILIPELGAAMLDAAMNGSEQGIMDNAFMRTKGQQALKVQPNETT